MTIIFSSTIQDSEQRLRKQLENLRAIFWDCDGTVVDNEVFALCQMQDVFIAWLKAKKETTVNIPKDFAVQFTGKPKTEVVRALAEKADVTLNEEEVGEVVQAIDRARAELQPGETVKGVTGIKKTLKFFAKRNVQNWIVTSSEKPRTESHLKHAGLLGYFSCHNRIVSYHTDCNGAAKPDAVGYLYALEKGALKNDQVVAIEDSASGVLAAARAGIPVIGILRGSHIKDKAKRRQELFDNGAIAVVDDYKDLRKFMSGAGLQGPRSCRRVLSPITGPTCAPP